MKKLFPLSLLMLIGLTPQQAWTQLRYVDPLFAEVTVTADLLYGSNISVLTGSPAQEDLLLDVYAPVGDTASQRPLVLIAHDGSFLPPPFNQMCTGTRQDSAVRMLCTLLAQRGYVAAAISYRLGWNPVSTTQDIRTGTYINALYRGIQDMRTAVRFFRADAATTNTYRIHPDQIAVGGLGTGGYLSLGTAYLDSYDEINLPKFIDFNTNTSYIDTSISGDLEGKNTRPLNLGNYVDYSSDVQFVFHLGGAVGDSSWIEADEPSVVSFHVPSDPFFPYDFGAIIVPTTGDFVVNMSGGKGIQRRAHALGLQTDLPLTDPYSVAADLINDGLDGLYPFFRPAGLETSPWAYFDTTCSNASTVLLTNPDMSRDKSERYLDTVVNYLAPRMPFYLGIYDIAASSLDAQAASAQVKIFPNPAQDHLQLRAETAADAIEQVAVFDLSGRRVWQMEGEKRLSLEIDLSALKSGIYLIKIQARSGLKIEKLRLD
ncbi:MAG: T9SS C-terminal target domain-containing protein [Bacteroidetes bacterium]|nr:MAG: T9SS C-terminal target domain-containing protein [Bacteroidota bacterium]